MNVDFVAATRNKYNEGTIENRAHAEVNELTQMNGKYYLSHDPEDANTDPGPDWNDAWFYINEDPNTISFSVSNLYPQAKYEFIFKVINTGTVPVKLKSYNITCDDDNEDAKGLFNQLKGKITIDPTAIKLEQGEEEEIKVTFEVPNWGGDNFEGRTCNFSIKFNFEQEDVQPLQ